MDSGILETDRLILRQLTLADADDLGGIFSDPETVFTRAGLTRGVSIVTSPAAFVLRNLADPRIARNARCGD